MNTKPSVAIYNPYLETKGGGEKVCLAMAAYLSHDYDVTLVSRKKIDVQELGSYFDLDLSRCKHYVLPRPSSIFVKASRRLRFPGRLRNLLHEYEDYRRLKQKHYDIFVNNCYKSNMPCPAPKGLYMCMFPQEFIYKDQFGLLKRLYHTGVDLIEKLLYGKRGMRIIHTYGVVTVNSSYTRSWTEKLWHVGPEEIDILYPICDDMGPADKKEKVILNVGRFFANSGENHYKCQDKLLEAFKKLPALHKAGWQLHFLGSVAEDTASLKYVLKLIQEGQNLPVYFHFNASFGELRDLYRTASIYWHATGWGSDPAKHPEKQEHFGISTVEAMSAGVVPIVIDSAGQRETIEARKDGYRWSNEKELLELTTKVAEDSKLRAQVSAQAVQGATKFDKAAFETRVAELFAKL